MRNADRRRYAVATRHTGPIAARPVHAHPAAAVAVRRLAELTPAPYALYPQAQPDTDWAAFERRFRRQRAALIATLAAVGVGGLAVAGYLTAQQLAATYPAQTAAAVGILAAVVVGLWLYGRRPRPCPGVVVHCPEHRG